MRQVFLDTVGLLALWDASDQWHIAAKSALQDITSSRVKTVSSEAVLLECGNAAARKPYRDEVTTLRLDLIDANALIRITQPDVDAAWEAFARREAAGAGIVDQLSFVLMRRLGMREVFTNDEHFRAAGFVTLF